MSQPALVLGTIQTRRPDDPWQALVVSQTNRAVIAGLTTAPHGLCADCFYMPPSHAEQPLLWGFSGYCPQPEQYWMAWLEAFESCLQQMIWSEVQLHLQTPWHGAHYLRWHAGLSEHQPGASVVVLRSDWEHDAGFFRFG